MRYYDLSVTLGGAQVERWTSHPNGLTAPPDPGALNVEFDLLASDYATPQGASSITIEGVPLASLFQAQQFAGMSVSLKAGMGAGLPLANPKQAGLLLAGSIFQSFGNWVGTDMTLDFVIVPSTYTFETPGNFVLNWPANTPLTSAIAATLKAAYPNAKQTIQISPNLMLPNAEWGYYHTLTQFAQAILSLTQGTLTPDYPGVTITMQGGQFFVYDGTTEGPNTALVFTDFIGQPTWIDSNVMQLKTVLRADLQLGQTITMPAGLQNQPGIVSTTAGSMPSNNKYTSAFQNNFTITQVRHIGNFRSPDAGQWASIFNCSPI